jgi:hypothetical protein
VCLGKFPTNAMNELLVTEALEEEQWLLSGDASDTVELDHEVVNNSVSNSLGMFLRGSVREHSDLVGVRIVFQLVEHGTLYVKSMRENSPAARSGLIQVGICLCEFHGRCSSPQCLPIAFEQLQARCRMPRVSLLTCVLFSVSAFARPGTCFGRRRT